MFTLTSGALARGFQVSTFLSGIGTTSTAVVGDGSVMASSPGDHSLYRFADQDGQSLGQFLSRAVLPNGGDANPVIPAGLLRLGDQTFLTSDHGLYTVSDNGTLVRQIASSSCLGVAGSLSGGGIVYTSAGSAITGHSLVAGTTTTAVSVPGASFAGVALSLDTTRLYAINTTNHRLEVYRSSDGTLAASGSAVSGAYSINLGSGLTAGKAYVGSTDGSLYELDLTSLASAPILIASGGSGTGLQGTDSGALIVCDYAGATVYRVALPQTLPAPAPVPGEVYSLPGGPSLSFARRIPRDPRTVPLAYVEIPRPDPLRSVSIIDTAGGTAEDVEPRSIMIPFTGETGAVSVYRDGPGRAFLGRAYGPLADLSTSPGGVFTVSSPDGVAAAAQSAASVPIRITRVEEDATGSWHPVLSRGLFYQVVRMEDDKCSWLSGAGFQKGQYLLAAYSTDLDWRARSAGSRGTSVSGGGSLWHPRLRVPVAQDPRHLGLFPTSWPTGTRAIALGGLSLGGVELLAESGASTIAPGDGSGVLGSLKKEIFQSSYSDPTLGRSRAASPISSGTVTSSSLASGLGFSTLLGAVDPTTVVCRLSGSFFVPTEGFYSLSPTLPGKVRLSHWGIPVIDRWYGALSSADSLPRATTYSGYFHAGWHDVSLDLGPESYADGGEGVFSLTSTGPGTLTFCSTPTQRSQVESLDLSSGQITLKNGFVGTDSLEASFATSGDGLPYTGFFESHGQWRHLDLNPSAGRYYLDGTQSTLDWLENTCVLWIVPSLVCALTDAFGNPLTGGSRNWVSCATYIRSTVQWGSISGRGTLQPGSSGVPFGAASSFGSESLGQSPYSSQGASEGLIEGTLVDPRGAYKSGFILGHLTVSDGLPSVDSLRSFDLRVRGGGLTHEIDPRNLAKGRERAETFWDLSPWEGNQESTAGKVLVRIPQAYLDGSDGLPSWSPKEIKDLVDQTIAAGLESIVEFV